MKFKSYINIEEATEYYQGEYGFKFIETHKKINMKSMFTKFSKDEMRRMFVTVKDLKLTNIILIKLPQEDCKFLEEIKTRLSDFKILKERKCSEVDIEMYGTVFRFYISGGRLKNITNYDGVSTLNKTPTTSQQEEAVVFCLNQKRYPTRGEINISQGFDFDNKWHESFEKTYDIITKTIDTSKYITYRDSDKRKPNFINRMTNDDILPDKKDNWNPSDIWIVKKSFSGKDIDDVVTAMEDGRASITDLNYQVNKQFKNKNLVGISLKKVDKSAKIETIEVDSAKITNIKFGGVHYGQQMSVFNSYYDISYNIKDNGIDINYFLRMRPRGKSGALSVYFEGQSVGTTVRDGAFSKDLLKKKYFKGVDKTVMKLLDEASLEIQTVEEMMIYIARSTKDKKLERWVKKGAQNKFIKITNFTQKSRNFYETQRGAMNTFYIYLFDVMDYKSILRDGYLSSKKMNEYSSIHLKIS